MAVLAQPAVQLADIEEAVKAVFLPEGVRFRRIYVDSDSTGDAAVFAVFGVSRKLGTGDAVIKKLRRLRKDVAQAIDDLRINSLPYVRFEDMP